MSVVQGWLKELHDEKGQSVRIGVDLRYRIALPESAAAGHPVGDLRAGFRGGAAVFLADLQARRTQRGGRSDSNKNLEILTKLPR